MKAQSLYIHIPFCLHKCLFCSFAIAVGQTHRAQDYLDRLKIEAKKYRGNELETIYVGGGTPSVLSKKQLSILMDIIHDNFSLSKNCEITIEANSEGLEEDKLKHMKVLGFNRISLGVQSLDDRYLKFLGRKHDSNQAKKTYETIRKVGFNNVNLDLMYAFPSQTLEELENDVNQIASLGSEHLSLYTLTIEPNSQFHVKAIKLDDEEKIATGYLKVKEILKDFGFNQYEISNFAKKGYQSKHNCNYWLGQRYIALGMGAHGFLENRRYWNKHKLQDYLNDQDFVEGFEDLSEQTMQLEKILFGLRMNEGVRYDLIPKEKINIIEDYIRDGFFVVDGNRLRATDKGQLVLDELSVSLI